MEINIKCNSSETKIIADLVTQLQSRQISGKYEFVIDPSAAWKAIRDRIAEDCYSQKTTQLPIQ